MTTGHELTRLLTAVFSLATDVGSLSDELHFAGRDAAERAELDHGRANSLRALELPGHARVLEVGAGFGALTRYLGERSAFVHAVEPDPGRAAAARLRTRDLDSVTVLAEWAPGDGDEYDLVVVAQAYATRGLLERVRARLAPNGAVVVLTSSPAVVSTMAAAGLPVGRELSCSPGHETARAVQTAALTAEFPRLAAGIASESARGLLLLAGPGAGALWPEDRLATYFNTTERATFACTRADVCRTPSGAEVRRVPLVPAKPVLGISVGPCTDAVRDAPTMVEVLLAEPWRVTELLTGWRDLLRREANGTGTALWDLVPHNVLVSGSELYPIDLEWHHEGAGVPEVTARGVLVLADLLATAGWSAAAPDGTMRELAGWLGVLIGLDPSFLDEAVEREVTFATIGSCGSDQGVAEIRAAVAEVWAHRLARRTAGAGQ
ncbi:class I SAM-dependent methyltransferase [Amycolatopsis sp. H20-H5]|uniref:class I SAM-dependent methyltransferase n=1 Tax=Amycolatopsis sp. H20-H5 TaxID=3046309 RepID=UPI002DBFF849|nr:methyltransferase [Amycolatopsis sp. H20-H5]MEC3981433.1 methyltransferase [Amycolatopsis sp. H20-H5]